MANCRSCNASILWVETEATAKKPGRNMPIDADENGHALEVPDANLVLVGTSGNGKPIARYVGKGRGKFVSHFATCPDRAEHRKR